MDRWFYEEKMMSVAHQSKFVHVGEYVAEVEVDLIETEGGWSPYISLEDAEKLDEIREALRAGNLKRAGQKARVYRLTPVEV